jgi:hypothetical protein
MLSSNKSFMIRYRIWLSALWLVPGAALFALWKVSYWVYALYGCSNNGNSFDSSCVAGPINLRSLAAMGWWCMLLWFPVLIVGVVQTGLSLQSRLSARGVLIKKFGYRLSLGLTPTSIFIWLAVTGIGICSTLIATYPERPTTVEVWLLIACPWIPLWLTFGWIQERLLNRAARRLPRDDA